ncbi:MAG TPA: hypothetical protein VK629_18750, partial [Steroidobacteraceae bacterium]|nr:hypothetical protein [Steroidobacteraceae bacterium]
EWSIAVERLMEEQRHLVARSERTPGEEKRLVELQKKLLSLPTESPEDERAMEIIRRAAAAIESQDRR